LLEEYEVFRRTNSGGAKAFLESLPSYRVGGYGGHTACFQVTSQKADFVIDGGSGIRRYGESLLMGPCGLGKGEVHIFMTHFHWDHLIGLPFFTPIFIGGNKIHLYAVQPELPDVFKTLFKKPYFPVPLEKLGAELHYHLLEPQQGSG
jgi:phosphoribosyl 1,2-cyclic phosphodiesterase